MSFNHARSQRSVSYVRVDLGRDNAAVAKETLDVADVNAFF
jgi:hypothetical protein